MWSGIGNLPYMGPALGHRWEHYPVLDPFLVVVAEKWYNDWCSGRDSYHLFD